MKNFRVMGFAMHNRLFASLLVAIIGFMGSVMTAFAADEINVAAMNFGISINKKASGKSYALIIANSNYAEENGGYLAGPAVDARNLKTTLIEQLGYTSENVFMIGDQEQTTRDEIWDGIDDFISEVPKRSNVLVYYAGHGKTFTGIPGNFLVPIEVKIPKLGKNYDRSFARRLVMLEDIAARINSEITPIGLTIFYNACRSGSADNLFMGASSEATASPATIRGSITFFSASRGQQALSGEIKDGVETSTLFGDTLISTLKANPAIDLPKLGYLLGSIVEQKASEYQFGFGGHKQEPSFLNSLKLKPNQIEHGMCLAQVEIDGQLTCTDTTGNAMGVRQTIVVAPKLVLKPGQIALSAARKTNTCEAYKQVENKFPDSDYAILAKAAAQNVCIADEKPQRTAKQNYELGMRRYDNGDYRAAYALFVLASDKNHAPAQTILGYMYEFGEAEEQNGELALKYYQLAAEQGFAKAQTYLGIMYENGGAVKKDDLRAVSYFELAADQGFALGQSWLGYMYKNGGGVKQDLEQARHYFELAAKQGNGFAKNQLRSLETKSVVVEKLTSADVAVQECDTLAAEYNSEEELAYGVDLSDMNFAAAILACKQTIEKYPDIARFEFLLGRAYLAKEDFTSAREWLQKASDKNYAAAQFNLANIYYAPKGVERNYLKAFELFESAAEQNYVPAYLNLGLMHANGQGIPQDYDKAIYNYQMAAEQKSAKAQFALGDLYYSGRGVIVDKEEALRWFSSSAALGYSEALAKAGAMYYSADGTKRDYPKAFDLFIQASMQENPNASYYLGKMYYYGHFVEVDKIEAFRHHMVAAELGDRNAQFTLGILFRTGDGVEKDDEQAFHWTLSASEQYHAKSYFNLGLMYENGLGTNVDLVKAVEAYQNGAYSIDPTAQERLAYLYVTGTGVEQDFETAANWYREARDNGSETAQARLDDMYKAGQVAQPVRDSVRELQALLSNVGCSTKGVDGFFGANSVNALNAFNQNKPNSCSRLDFLPAVSSKQTPQNNWVKSVVVNIKRLKQCTAKTKQSICY